MSGRSRIIAYTLTVLPLAGLAACTRTVAQPPPAKPPVVVTDMPVTREVTDYEDFVGQTAAVRSVEVRARVNGYLEKVLFTDGEEVEEGAELFLIDSRSYDAEYARTVAAVVQSEAHAKRLEGDYGRAKSLQNREVYSAQEFGQVSGDYNEALAAVGIAVANRDLAKLNQSFTRVTAPISGRLSRRQVDPGNLVKADDTALTTIVSLDPMYVYFDIDERTLLRLRRLIADGKIQSREQAAIPIYGALADEANFPHKGIINFSENRVDASTGTLRVRAEIANPKPRVFSPGFFMRVRLPVGVPYQATLIPEQALATDQGRRYLYIVKNGKNKEGKDADIIEYRPVKVGALHDGLRIVQEGLSAGERVVVSGLQRVRPGVEVTAMPVKTETASQDKNDPSAKPKVPAGG